MSKRKAVLSNRIFFNVFDEELREKLRKKLTYRIPRYGEEEDEVICDLAEYSGNLISVPFSRIDLIPKDYILVNKRAVVEAEIPKFQKELRPNQLDVVNNVSDSCLINAPPGFGKTFTSMAIIEKLRQKTLIIVHTADLRKQWVQEIKSCFGFEPDTIGGGSKKYSTPIVVGTIQTISNMILELKNEFGLIIIDEVHHLPASRFKKVIDKFKSRYRIGLSATLKRKDQKDVFLTDYISYDIIVTVRENIIEPCIKIIKSNVPLSSNNMIPWATRINRLYNDPDYKVLVASLTASKALQGHKVLLVADRIDFLETISYGLEGSMCYTNAGKSKEELNKQRDYLLDNIDKELNIVCGTTSIFKEGINIPELSCLILATPINNEPLLEQLIGRICRKKEGKKQPEVIDIVLKGRTGKNQSLNRERYYHGRGLDIDYIQL